MQHYDATLKQLFERAARGLLRTLTGGATVTEWMNVELPSVRVPRMDLLGRLDNGSLLNIEFQTTNEERLPERVAVYYLETRMRRDEHVDQVVLYLGKEPIRMRNAIETPAMHFRFRLIDIGATWTATNWRRAGIWETRCWPFWRGWAAGSRRFAGYWTKSLN
ncbi:MAG TPA: hypothetical protein VGH38_33845 [Bryobacteraceae bacterium]|jgi:hypothetical protein